MVTSQNVNNDVKSKSRMIPLIMSSGFYKIKPLKYEEKN